LTDADLDVADVVIDVVPILRTARFDRTLSYRAPAAAPPIVGELVRVPLGPREVYSFVTDVHTRASVIGLRPIASRVAGPRAFDENGLHLARWMAEHYRCGLREALGCSVQASAIPRTVDSFTLVRSEEPSLPSVPRRLVRLIWEDLREGFTLEALLRNPDARRAADRATLLRALGALVRAGALERTRSFAGPRVRAARERWLEPTGVTIAGPRAAALVARVAEEGSARRRDLLLEGFSPALIARTLRDGALRAADRAQKPARTIAAEPHAHTPTPEQVAAIDAIAARADGGAFAEILLEGVTGSGKTLVYIEAIRHTIAHGGRAIVLVPEIALTRQTARRFEGAFADRVVVLHSALSERERFDAWRAAADGTIDVVVGARSAVFAPLAKLKLIIVDEAHERSYKQDGTPRYHALTVARERTRSQSGVLVLGSATPPLESYAAARDGRIDWLRLPFRATAQPMPEVRVVDMAAEFTRGHRRIFSSVLVEAIGERLAGGEKVVLFVNRRGSAGFLLCRACGFVPECSRCSVSLVAHRSEGLLRCHLCDLQRAIPERCERCGSPALREFGAGTERVAEEIGRLFPAARVVRMDSDTTTRVGAHARLLDQFGGEGDVLVGTQMVAKGLDFPTVTLVGVVAADIGLHVPEFRAAERSFDLLSQVIGRSGRARAGAAIVQTYSPEHPAVACAAAHDFAGFADYELAQRKPLHYPPYGELAYLGIIGRGLSEVVERANGYAAALRSAGSVEVLGPAPYATPRVNDEWRYRIVLKACTAASLRAAIAECTLSVARNERATRLAIDLEP